MVLGEHRGRRRVSRGPTGAGREPDEDPVNVVLPVTVHGAPEGSAAKQWFDAVAVIDRPGHCF
jgi:hypothetical protein